MTNKALMPSSICPGFTEGSSGREVRISVIGVGGCGGNIVNSICMQNLGIRTIAVNTDSQAIKNNAADRTLIVGGEKTSGLGAGANVEVGEVAVRESLPKILDMIRDEDMVFIVAGMGGGTGTKGASVLADAISELGISVISFATMPFFFEGQGRLNKADSGISQLRESSDAVICVNNQRLISKLKGTKLNVNEGFKVIDKVLISGIKIILDLISEEQQINVDFADIKTTLSKGGSVIIGEAEASGPDRASIVVSKLFSLALAGSGPISSAKGAILVISGSNDLGFEEAASAAEAINRKMGGGDIEVIFGIRTDPMMPQGAIKVSIIAAGIEEVSVEEGSLSNALAYIHSMDTAPRQSLEG